MHNIHNCWICTHICIYIHTLYIYIYGVHGVPEYPKVDGYIGQFPWTCMIWATKKCQGKAAKLAGKDGSSPSNGSQVPPENAVLLSMYNTQDFWYITISYNHDIYVYMYIYTVNMCIYIHEFNWYNIYIYIYTYYIYTYTYIYIYIYVYTNLVYETYSSSLEIFEVRHPFQIFCLLFVDHPRTGWIR